MAALEQTLRCDWRLQTYYTCGLNGIYLVILLTYSTFTLPLLPRMICSEARYPHGPHQTDFISICRLNSSFFNRTKLADTLSRITNLLALKPYTFLTLVLDAARLIFVFIGQKSGSNIRSNQLMRSRIKVNRTVEGRTGAKFSDKEESFTSKRYLGLISLRVCRYNIQIIDTWYKSRFYITNRWPM